MPVQNPGARGILFGYLLERRLPISQLLLKLRFSMLVL